MADEYVVLDENNRPKLIDTKPITDETRQKMHEALDRGAVPVAIPSDPVNHPSHYKSGGLEAIDVIEAFGLGFALGNCVKYVLRAGKKDAAKEVEDLRKAKFYLERQIATLEKRRG